MKMSGRFTLAICELFSPTIHGKTERSSRNIDGQWLVHMCIPIEEFYDGTYKEDVEALCLQHRQDGRNVQLDIIMMDELEDGGELVGIIHTHLLNTLQRKWKKKYQRNMALLRERASLSSLRERQINGRWSK